MILVPSSHAGREDSATVKERVPIQPPQNGGESLPWTMACQEASPVICVPLLHAWREDSAIVKERVLIQLPEDGNRARSSSKLLLLRLPVAATDA